VAQVIKINIRQPSQEKRGITVWGSVMQLRCVPTPIRPNCRESEDKDYDNGIGKKLSEFC